VIGEAIKLYEEVIRFPLPAGEEPSDELVKAKETAVYKLAGLYRDKSLVDELI
jgi:hypothetical protein